MFGIKFIMIRILEVMNNDFLLFNCVLNWLFMLCDLFWWVIIIVVLIDNNSEGNCVIRLLLMVRRV